jgi:hypothetical protein
VASQVNWILRALGITLVWSVLDRKRLPAHEPRVSLDPGPAVQQVAGEGRLRDWAS